MKENKFSFWISPDKPIGTNRFFGCTSHGTSNSNKSIAPNECGSLICEHKLPGEIFCGTYRRVLNSLTGLSFSPEICIVLYKKAEGFEDFIIRVSKVLPSTSFIGGGASFVTDISEGELLPEAEDVCVFAISETNYRIETLNIYKDTKQQVKFEANSKRELTKIKELPNGKWQSATSFYRSKQIQFGIEPNKFENLCFCDKNGRNLHCSISDGKLFVGANLPEENILTLNYTSQYKAIEKLNFFIEDTDSLIFGCAGIRSLIDQPIFTGKRSLVGFMFGEIVTCGESVELGNLMLTKLKIL